MQKLIVNGKFLTQKITGVQRYAREVLRQLNNKTDIEVIVVVPTGTDDFSKEYQNIKFENYGKHQGYYWEQFEFAKYCKKNKNIPVLNMCNISPFKIRNSYVVLHDTTFKDKNNYTSKLWSLRYRILVRSYINKVNKIFTDSLFTVNLIKKHYKKIKNNPIPTYIGYEQIENIEIEEIKDIPNNFIFSVGSVNPNKNFKYVLYLAKNNPDRKDFFTVEWEFENDKPSDRYILVLDDNNNPVSTVRFLIDNNNYGLIERVRTLPTAEKKGYGKLAMLEGEKWLADLGVKRVFVEAIPPALEFYKKVGYELSNDKDVLRNHDTLLLMEKNI